MCVNSKMTDAISGLNMPQIIRPLEHTIIMYLLPNRQNKINFLVIKIWIFRNMKKKIFLLKAPTDARAHDIHIYICIQNIKSNKYANSP